MRRSQALNLSSSPLSAADGTATQPRPTMLKEQLLLCRARLKDPPTQTRATPHHPTPQPPPYAQHMTSRHPRLLNIINLPPPNTHTHTDTNTHTHTHTHTGRAKCV